MSFTSLLKAGNVAVVTGASSGIGRAASLFFAEKGLDVWMVDIDAEELALAKDLVQSNASNATIYKEVIDVSDTASVAALSERVFSVSRKVNILMNNAAVHAVSEATSSLDDVASLQRVVSINTFGPINGCVAFIPKMQETKEEGYVINTGSKQGIVRKFARRALLALGKRRHGLTPRFTLSLQSRLCHPVIARTMSPKQHSSATRKHWNTTCATPRMEKFVQPCWYRAGSTPVFI